MIKYKIFEQKSAMGADDTRKTIYYPQIVDLSKMETTEFVDNIANLGSSAYSRGELQGVALDLGRAIAQMLINGNKVTIAGLGTFSPKLQTSQSNITDATEINKRYFSCDVTFKPSDDFKAILDKANYVKAGSSDSSDAGQKYTVAYNNPEAGVLTLTASVAEAFAGLEVDDITLKLNGNAVEPQDVTDNSIRVTGLEAGTYTIELTVPQHDDYARYNNTWTNVEIDGESGKPEYTLSVSETPNHLNGGFSLIPSNEDILDGFEFSFFTKAKYKLHSDSEWTDFTASNFNLRTNPGRLSFGTDTWAMESTSANIVIDVDIEIGETDELAACAFAQESLTIHGGSND